MRVLPQPTGDVCGPTCLHAIYRFLGRDLPIERVIEGVRALPDGGTLAVFLGIHALREGFRATVYTNNLQTFDPTWFRPGIDLADKLAAQKAVKTEPKLHIASDAYLEFLGLGGRVRMRPFTRELLRGFLDRGLPILAGLSSTYLYDCPRELPNGEHDDIGGFPGGHFVVVSGYDADREHVLIADPLPDNPKFEKPYYSVDLNRLLAAVHLGIVTYDANLLVIEPPEPRS